MTDELHGLFETPLDIEVTQTSRGENWSLRGHRFKQRSDAIPRYLRQAFSCAGSSEAWKQFLADRLGNKPWTIELPCDGVSLSRDLFYELSIEHGYHVLKNIFRDPT